MATMCWRAAVLVVVVVAGAGAARAPRSWEAEACLQRNLAGQAPPLATNSHHSHIYLTNHNSIS